MEGAADAERKRFDLAMITAWHTEGFARTKKLPKLASILSDTAPKPKSSARAFFEGLKAQGMPIKITRNEIN